MEVVAIFVVFTAVVIVVVGEVDVEVVLLVVVLVVVFVVVVEVGMVLETVALVRIGAEITSQNDNNSLPYVNLLHFSKLKKFADDNLSVVKMVEFVNDRKHCGKNTDYLHFFLHL